MTLGRGSVAPSVRHASVNRLRSSAFIGLPCPTNSAGIFGPTVTAFLRATRPALPDLAALALRSHHGRTRLAGEGTRELGQVRNRSDHAVLADRVRVALHHGARELRSHGIAAELTPGDEELLLLREPVDGRQRRL